MLKPVSIPNFLFAYSADCPSDNYAHPLAQFLYETLGTITVSFILVKAGHLIDGGYLKIIIKRD
jgi:hypothetical protein